MNHLELGAAGESLAVRFLERKGWRIRGRNVRVGRGELDIVAADDGGELVIVEVRTRTIGRMLPPDRSVGPRKLRKLIQTSKQYVNAIRYDGCWRIDVVAVTVDAAGEPHVEHFGDITMGMEADRL